MCVSEHWKSRKEEGYTKEQLNFNFKKVSFSSRSHVKIIFKAQLDCWGLTGRTERAAYSTMRARANIKRMAVNMQHKPISNHGNE